MIGNVAVVLLCWVFASAGFVLGCFWAGRKVLELEAANNRLIEQGDDLRLQAEVSRRTEDHSGCESVVVTLSSAVRSQQAYIDALEQASDLGDQAEQFLREAGS